jgi:tetratricopeptide (TPR) repeat protein
MDTLKQVSQYGNKSIYIEENTGNIQIVSPHGEVKIISLLSENDIQELLAELGNQREILEDVLKHIKPGHIQIPHELTQPPVRPDVFIGRDKDMENLSKDICNGQSLHLLVNGHGGIGKSTLAARYYHEFKDEYNHVIWLLSKKSIANALFMLRDTLGFTPDQKLMTTEEQMEIMLTKLANLKKPSLLVIDNANELDDLRQNYLVLKRCSNLHVILTTRITEFDNVPCFKVKGLSEPYAIELFKKYYPHHNEEENDLLKEIIINIANNTLIIELLAKNLRELNKLEPQYSLQQLANDLQQSLLKLSKSHKISTFYQTNSQNLRIEKPEDIVMAMYDFSELDDGEKQMISVFTVLPNEAIRFDFLKLCFADQDIATALESIAQKGWVDFIEEDKLFKVNQIIQDVAFEKQKDRLFTDCKPMIETITNYLNGEDILHHDRFVVTQLLVNYAVSISNKITGENEELALLCHNLGIYHSSIGDIVRSLTAYEKMYTIFQKLHESDIDNPEFKNGLAISYSKLGQTHSELGNLEKALNYFEKDIELSKELYEAYPQNVSFKNGLAISYEKLGSFHRDNLKNSNEAMICFKKAQLLWKELVQQAPEIKKFGMYYNQINIDIDNLKKR